MKQRVTDEQAQADAICELYCPDCELAISKPEDWKCQHGETAVRKYAADLLDTRAQLAIAVKALEKIQKNGTYNTLKGRSLSGEIIDSETIINEYGIIARDALKEIKQC